MRTKIATSKGASPLDPRDLSHSPLTTGGDSSQMKRETENRLPLLRLGSTRRSGCVPALPYLPVVTQEL